jgi:hypothetical protein
MGDSVSLAGSKITNMLDMAAVFASAQVRSRQTVFREVARSRLGWVYREIASHLAAAGSDGAAALARQGFMIYPTAGSAVFWLFRRYRRRVQVTHPDSRSTR